MQGLYHDFILVRENSYAYSDYYDIAKTLRSEAIELGDDFVWYIYDTLLWIRTINPSNSQEWSGYGLNLYGPTIINKNGAEVAKHVFGAWASLFMQGPQECNYSPLCKIVKVCYL